jgi:hypothetical protein
VSQYGGEILKLTHWIDFHEEPNTWDVIPEPQEYYTGVYVPRMPLWKQWVVRGDLSQGLPLVIILPDGRAKNGVV